MFLSCVPLAAHAADLNDQIGLTSLLSRPNALLADGAGVVVGQVEATLDNGGSAPDLTDPAFKGKDFTLVGISDSPISAHATDVAARIYGKDGIAPGVSTIKLFSEDSFVYEDGLHSHEPALPERLGVSIINNSWVGASSWDFENKDILRRLDFVAARDDVLVVNSANNGQGTEMPKLMASQYNGMTIGVPGASSVGPVYFDGAPRAKPDLVAPAGSTSEAAAVVSGAAAVLMSEAKKRHLPLNALATKAILMAGADHLPGYQRGRAGRSDDARVPLDYAQGAGLLRIDHSFDIMTAGTRKPNSKVRNSGWTTATAAARRTQSYNFTAKTTIPEFQAVLDWNRRISMTPANAMSVSTRAVKMANLDLTLQKRSRNRWVPVFRSASVSDNVECIYIPNLAPGSYRMLVSSNQKEQYALAWFSDMNLPSSTEIAAASLPAAPSAGSGYPRPLFASAVPEPGSALAWLGAGALLLRRRRAARAKR